MTCMYVDGQLLIQTVLYFAILAAGLATSISSGLAKSDFGGHCILYGTAECYHSPGTSSPSYNCTFTAGQASMCSFVTGTNVFVCVFYALACGCYHAYTVHRSRVIIRVASQMWLRTLLFGTSLALLVTLVASCSLTVGLSNWCDSALSPPSVTNASVSTTSSTLARTATTTTALTTVNGTLIPTSKPSERRRRETSGNADVPSFSCISTQNDDVWRWYYGETEVKAGSYYYFYSVAESSCWVSVAFWLIQLGFYIRRLVKNCRQRQQNTYQDPFTTDDAFDVFT